MSSPDIQKLIDKYGLPVWDAAMRQVYVSVAIDLFWIALLIVAFIVAVKALQWALRRIKEEKATGSGYEPEFGYQIGAGLIAVGGGVSLLVMVLIATQVVSYLLNPAWAAISIILGAATGSSSS